ncbi:MAG TPA: hypothetical protein VJB57_11065 [Dehalococcoidia bacterium]|nr:hypothetical protein [Dehalococcoidia bacterium]
MFKRPAFSLHALTLLKSRIGRWIIDGLAVITLGLLTNRRASPDSESDPRELTE